MNWDAIGAVAELLGASGVIASLAYLALQVRQNTRQMRLNAESLSMMHEMGGAELSNAIALQVMTDPDLADLVRRARHGEADLSPNERVRWGTYLLSALLIMQAGYHNYRKGLADEDSWKGHARGLVALMDCSGARDWWAKNQQRFSDSFVTFLDGELHTAADRRASG